VHPAGGVAHEDEGAAGAEQVANGEQRHDQQPAVVHPRQDGGQVRRCQLRAGQAVQHHQRGHGQQHELQRRYARASTGAPHRRPAT
jgi:hypothetical protein